MITAHFSWKEANAHSGYAGHYPPRFTRVGLKVVPLRNNIRKHARNLERLRTEVNRLRARHGKGATGITVLSWVRSPAHNAEVGGARDSRHMYGDATDISLQEIDRLCPWTTGRDDFDAVAGRVFKTGGFGTYPAGNRHVDSRGVRARWSSWRR